MAAKGTAALWIRVDDLERYAPSPVAPYLDGLVVVDALGRGWLADSDAKVVLEKARAEWNKEIGRRSEYDAWLKDRQARRTALATKIRDDANANSPASSAAIRARLHEALQEFDQSNPDVGYYEWLERQPTIASAR